MTNKYSRTLRFGCSTVNPIYPGLILKQRAAGVNCSLLICVLRPFIQFKGVQYLHFNLQIFFKDASKVPDADERGPTIVTCFHCMQTISGYN